jgi:hypothetical protein
MIPSAMSLSFGRPHPDDGIDKCWFMSSVTVVSTLTRFNSAGLNLTRTWDDIWIRSRSNLRKEAPVETP